MYPDIFSHNFSESSNKCWSLSVVPKAQRNLETCQFASCCVWANSWSWVLTQTGVCSVAGSALASAGLSLLLIRGSPGPGSPLEPHQPHSIAISSLPGCSEGLCEGFSEPWGYLCMKGNGDGTVQALAPFSTVPPCSTGRMAQIHHIHAVGRAGSCTTTADLELGREKGQAEPQWVQLVPCRAGSTQGGHKQVCAPWPWGHQLILCPLLFESMHIAAPPCPPTIDCPWQLCHPEKGRGKTKRGPLKQ